MGVLIGARGARAKCARHHVGDQEDGRFFYWLDLLAPPLMYMVVLRARETNSLGTKTWLLLKLY